MLSTLHTNDAASAINRLLDLGVNASILASSLSMIVAQRLVRLLCPRCSEREPITEEERKVVYEQRHEPPEELAKARGCDSCLQSGYKGRGGIYEVIVVDREIEKMIFTGALHREIEDRARSAGYGVDVQTSPEKVSRHLTSLDEVQRVIVDYA